MPVSVRPMTVALCDNCGKEVTAEQTERPLGYYMNAAHVKEDSTIITEAFACNPYCIQGAIEGALQRQLLNDDEYSHAIHELWSKGRGYRAVDTFPALPVVRAENPEYVIGKAYPINRRVLNKP